jgi:nitrile hydratase accessory protein
MRIEPLPDAAAIPSDDEGPVFREPWEAQAFAIVVSLHQAGAFTWPEWVETISGVIARAQAAGDPDHGDHYYEHWLVALERILLAKRLTSDGELHARLHDIAAHVHALHEHPAQRAPLFVG